MAGVRFEDVDLLGALSRIVDLHTQHYKEDFDLDKELMLKPPCIEGHPSGPMSGPVRFYFHKKSRLSYR